MNKTYTALNPLQDCFSGTSPGGDKAPQNFYSDGSKIFALRRFFFAGHKFFFAGQKKIFAGHNFGSVKALIFKVVKNGFSGLPESLFIVSVIYHV